MIQRGSRMRRLRVAYCLLVGVVLSLGSWGCSQQSGVSGQGLADTSAFVVVIERDEIDSRSKGLFLAANASEEDKTEAVLQNEASLEGLEVRETFPHVAGMLIAKSGDEMPELCEEAGVYCEANVAIQLDDPEPDASAEAVQPGAPWGLDMIDGTVDGTYNYDHVGAGVNAYVLDTGVRASHEDFEGRVAAGFNSYPDQASNNANDCNGHGTHVAGTIAGATYGVAKASRVVPVRVLGCGGGGTVATVVAGIDWVTANATLPAVANMSLGGGASTAIDVAVQNSIKAGITYVVAAGNASRDADLFSPARVKEAITVGATDQGNRRAWFSNFGSTVDLFAPGVDIPAPWIFSDSSTNTISGTSMATPHVAGVVAQYLGVYPNATPDAVLRAIASNATSNVVTDVQGATNRLLKNSEIELRTPLSYDGTIIVGDFNGDGHDDMMHRAPAPSFGLEVALKDGASILEHSTVQNSGTPGADWSLIDSGDFNGDGKDDIVWRNANGSVAIWLMDGVTFDGGYAILGANDVAAAPGPAWKLLGTGDFDGDGEADLAWQHDNGICAIWLLDGDKMKGGAAIGAADPTRKMVAFGRFDGDANTDIVLRHSSGQVSILFMDGATIREETTVLNGSRLPAPGPAWAIKDAGDFDGDGTADLLWQHDNGAPAIWLMDGARYVVGKALQRSNGAAVGNPGPAWIVQHAGDFDGNGVSDILWRHNSPLNPGAVWGLSAGPELVASETYGF